MVDSSPLDTFSARLDFVLGALGMSNKEFADKVDPDGGQQKVYNWRARGRIGGPSLVLVSRILGSRVNMLWLNEGLGQALVPAGIPAIAEQRLKEAKTAEKVRQLADLQPVVEELRQRDTSQPAPHKASHSEQLDDDRLTRAVRFLERQFALWDREFVASQHIDLITGVYARLGHPQESNLVQLSQWLLEQIEKKGDATDVEQRRAGGP
jgi:hypothetical protein